MDSSAHPNTKIFAYIFGSFWADGHPNKLGVPKHHAFGSSQFRSYFVLSQIRPYIVTHTHFTQSESSVGSSAYTHVHIVLGIPQKS